MWFDKIVLLWGVVGCFLGGFAMVLWFSGLVLWFGGVCRFTVVLLVCSFGGCLFCGCCEFGFPWFSGFVGVGVIYFLVV